MNCIYVPSLLYFGLYLEKDGVLWDGLVRCLDGLILGLPCTPIWRA
jgi:hypothetical protein